MSKIQVVIDGIKFDLPKDAVFEPHKGSCFDCFFFHTDCGNLCDRYLAEMERRKNPEQTELFKEGGKG